MACIANTVLFAIGLEYYFMILFDLAPMPKIPFCHISPVYVSTKGNAQEVYSGPIICLDLGTEQKNVCGYR